MFEEPSMLRSRRLIWVVGGATFFGALIVWGVLFFATDVFSSDPRFKERLLATLPNDLPNLGGTWGEMLDIGPYGQCVAYREERGSRQGIVIGGRKGPEFDEVGAPGCSPDGSKVAYWAREADRYFVAVGDRKGPEFDLVKEVEVRPDGSRVPHVYFSMAPPLFSSDSTRVAYRAWHSGKAFVVVGEDIGPKFDGATGVVFSPDGTKVAYVAQQGARLFVMVGDIKGAEFFLVGPPAFSPDGMRVAYKAFQITRMPNAVIDASGSTWPIPGEGRWALVVENLAAPGVSVSPLHVSAVSSSLLESILPDDEDQPVFSSDGYHMAYRTRSEALLGGMFVVSDGHKGAEFRNVGRPVFNPDGSKVAYTAQTDYKTVVVVRERPEEKFGVVTIREQSGPQFESIKELKFSPDGTKLAYAARQNGDWLVVVGNQQGPTFDSVEELVFSPDGKKLAYGARKGNEVWWKVMKVR